MSKFLQESHLQAELVRLDDVLKRGVLMESGLNEMLIYYKNENKYHMPTWNADIRQRTRSYIWREHLSQWLLFQWNSWDRARTHISHHQRWVCTMTVQTWQKVFVHALHFPHNGRKSELNFWVALRQEGPGGQECWKVRLEAVVVHSQLLKKMSVR